MPAMFSREEIDTSRRVVHEMILMVAMAMQDAISGETLTSLTEAPVWLVDLNDSLDEIPTEEWLAIIEAKTKEAMEQ